MSPSGDAAVQSSPARSASRTLRRAASRWSGASATTNGSRSRSRRSTPSCSRRGARRPGIRRRRAARRAGTPSASASVSPSSDGDLASGGSSRTRATAAGTSAASAVGKAPIRSRARSRGGELRQLDAGELEPLGDRVGVREQDRRPRVSCRPPGRRSSSRAPTSRSSAATCCETAGCVSASSRAARGERPPSATARNVRTRRESIDLSLSTDENHYLNEWPRGRTLNPCSP